MTPSGMTMALPTAGGVRGPAPGPLVAAGLRAMGECDLPGSVTRGDRSGVLVFCTAVFGLSSWHASSRSSSNASGGFLPLPHPSPRNVLWRMKNPWFELELVPELRRQVDALGLSRDQSVSP